MNRDIHLFSCMHKESANWPQARCQMKMVRRLGDTTLLDIFAPKFWWLMGTGLFKTGWIEVPERKSEDEVARRLVTHGVSVMGPAGRGHYKTLEKTNAQFVLWVNPCLPFLRVGTILEAVAMFKRAGKKATGLTAVARRKNWFCNPETSEWLTIPDPSSIRTQEALPLHEAVHAFHIYPRKHKLRTGGYWGFTGPEDPLRFEIESELECLDVDSLLDFHLIDGLLRAGHARLPTVGGVT